MFQVKDSKLPGCFEIIFKKIDDRRGSFIKTFHSTLFKSLNIEMAFNEEYFTHSVKNVFRGLHFQNPPKALDKMVFCVSGKVTDYLVDLREGSPTYGQWTSFELDGDNPKAIFVPIGVAHGFHVSSESAIMQYKVSEVYDPACDAGISYSSFSFAEKIQDPIISERDQKFESFATYKTPFKF